MRRSFLPQLLAAPAVAALLLLSPVNNAQAKSNNEWVQEAAGGALAGAVASSLFAWLCLGYFYQAIPTVDKKIKDHFDKIDENIKKRHNNLLDDVEKSISNYTKEMQRYITIEISKINNDA